MKVYRANIYNPAPILLGRQGESGAVQVAIDLSDIISKFGSGTAVLLHNLCGVDEAYVCATYMSGDNVIWDITDTDTASVGTGTLELQYVTEDALVKPSKWKTITLEAVTAPDGYLDGEEWEDIEEEETDDLTEGTTSIYWGEL